MLTVQTPRTIDRRTSATNAPPAAGFMIAGLALAVLTAHLLTNAFSPYGIHRDEFLYMAMGEHLRLFRMDFPPLIAILSEFSRLFGDSLVAIRILPAFAGAAMVLLAAMLARTFGGGRYAQVLAGLAVAVGPLFLRPGNLFQPVVFDQLWWTLGYLALARLCRSDFRGDDRWWAALGVAAGFGLLTKFSIVFFGGGVLAGLLATRHRRALLGAGPWVALGIALVIGSPSLVGQVRLEFPVLGQMAELERTQLERITYSGFLTGQADMLGPAFALALAGLAALLFARAYQIYRVVGWSVLAAFLIVMLLRGKPYYIGPIYPVLFGAGAAAFEAWTAGWIRRGATHAARGGAAAVLAAFGMITLPLGLPILPPATMAQYASTMGMTEAVRTNYGSVLPLPQDYADMLGWEEQVRAVAEVFHSLPPGDREAAVIIADNYGEAAAIDFYGPALGLPPARYTSSTYWFWGPGDKPGDVVLKVGGSLGDDLEPYFRSVTQAAVVRTPWVVPEEQDLPIWICRQPYRTLQELWPSFAGEY